VSVNLSTECSSLDSREDVEVEDAFEYGKSTFVRIVEYAGTLICMVGVNSAIEGAYSG
jgi:hypothetical protein